jgi:hypothetical protein
MKKAVLTLSVAGLCFAASAHSASDGKRQLGRHDSDSVVRTAAVPEVVPTIALVLMSVASLTVLAAYVRGKRSRA